MCVQNPTWVKQLLSLDEYNREVATGHTDITGCSCCLLHHPRQLLQTMSNSERFTRAMLTIKSAFGVPAAWEFWMRMGHPVVEQLLAGGKQSKIDAEFKSAFISAWTEAAKSPKTSKAKVAAKKDGIKVWCAAGIVPSSGSWAWKLARVRGFDYGSDFLL